MENYTTKTKLPFLSTHITIRKNMGVLPDDEVAKIYKSGIELTGDVTFVPDTLWIWMQLTKGNYIGSWIALRDGKGKVFVDKLPTQESPTPTDLLRYYVKPDQRTSRWNYTVRPVAPDPSVMPLSLLDGYDGRNNDTSYTVFTESMQWLWCDILAVSKYGRLFKELSRDQRNFIAGKFTAICGSDKAFHDYHGVDFHKNYPQRKNLDKDDALQESKICVNNYVYSDSKPHLNRHGKWMVNILTFYPNTIPTNITAEAVFTDPRIQEANIINKNGTFQRFPQLADKGSSFAPRVYFPVITRSPDYSWYPLDWLEVSE